MDWRCDLTGRAPLCKCKALSSNTSATKKKKIIIPKVGQKDTMFPLELCTDKEHNITQWNFIKIHNLYLIMDNIRKIKIM
jgi:hypothetical protein